MTDPLQDEISDDEYARNIERLMAGPAYADASHVDHRRVSELVRDYYRFDHQYPPGETGSDTLD